MGPAEVDTPGLGGVLVLLRDSRARPHKSEFPGSVGNLNYRRFYVYNRAFPSFKTGPRWTRNPTYQIASIRSSVT